MDPFIDPLNEPQREAVLHERGPLLVLAGAGSGKTRVITHRIAHLVKKRHVFPWKILAVTFTNKAAREMRERLTSLLGPAAGMLTVSTFHSAAAMLLRREADNLGISRSFVIYDDADQLRTVKRAIREADIDLASVNPREFLSRIEAEKNQGRLPDQMQPGEDTRARLTQKVYRKYQKLLRAADALDFGDLLLQLVELLRVNEEVRLRYQRRFEHVLVDEFQDTNPVQYELLRLLAPPPASNVVVVGDDDQSIYRWRGAEVDNILGFPTDYPGCKVVKLEQNYRSDQTILEAAHAVISRNRRRMEKKLWSARAKGEKLELLVARDERGEAQEVAANAQTLRLEGVADWEQMAVFFRTNAQSRVLEETFRLMRVPYVLVSGRSFYDRAEIRDAASYLRLMVNPKSDADFERVVNVPARGIGDTTVERVRAAAEQEGVSLYEATVDPAAIETLGTAAVKRLKGFRELVDRLVAFAKSTPDATSAAQYMLSETGLVTALMAEGTEESVTRAENLKELLTATREFDEQRATRLGQQAAPPPPRTALEEAIEEEEQLAAAQGDLFSGVTESGYGLRATGYGNAGAGSGTAVPDREVADADPVERDALAPDAPESPEAGPEPGARSPQPAADPPPQDAYSLEVEAPPLQAFLEQISLVGEADGDTGAGRGRVSLMTLHAAKGLEFDAVFITGMEEEIFPHRRATGPDAEEEDMAEERRLCYVGFTRARRRLFCSFAQSRTLFGELRFNAPSRFLAEVPQELFDFDELEVQRATRHPARPPAVRRRDDGDDGPVIDRSYDQSTDFHGDGDGDVKGLRVSHSQFGRGVVVDVVGRGPNAKLTVRFESVGVKVVIARYLTPG